VTSPDLYDRLLEIDARLAAKGIPALSPFWKRECRRFLRGGKRRWVIRSGRRAGKSLTMAKLALTFALFGPWTMPIGEVATIPFLSTERREAAARIRQIAGMLDALGEGYDKREDEVELRSRPCVLRVVTASVRATAGFTSVFVVCDEVAKWKDEASGANPANEVIASVTPTMATIESARIVLASSPWSEVDPHAVMYDAGEDDAQCVSFCESWIGNPSITRESTRKDAPSELVWLREYAARPSAATTSLISKDEYSAIEKKGIPRLPPIAGARHLIGLDVGLRNDRTAIVVTRKELRPDPTTGDVREVLVVAEIAHLVPGILKRISIDDVVDAVAKVARTYPGTVYADAHYYDAVAPALRQRGLQVEEVPMTPAAISARVAALQSRLSTPGTIEVVEHDELRREILNAIVVHHNGGRITAKAPEKRGAHDDILSALLITTDPEYFRPLAPCEGEVIVKYGAINFDPEARALDVGRTRYFTRTADGREVEREPPFGSVAFVRWAQEIVAQGGFSASIERWCAELGVEPKPGLDPELLDPANRVRGLTVRVRND
jgi:hypothetical protein